MRLLCLIHGGLGSGIWFQILDITSLVPSPNVRKLGKTLDASLTMEAQNLLPGWHFTISEWLGKLSPILPAGISYSDLCNDNFQHRSLQLALCKTALELDSETAVSVEHSGTHDEAICVDAYIVCSMSTELAANKVPNPVQDYCSLHPRIIKS